MALRLRFAVVMCDLLTRLQGTRIDRGNAQKIRISGPSSNMVVDGENLLACVVGETKDQTIIQAKDKVFWNYYYTKENHYDFFRPANSRSINCKPYIPPPKLSSVLKNLTMPALGEDVIDLVGSFDDSALNCRPCGLIDFDAASLDMCNAPSIGGPPEAHRVEFMRVKNHVRREGGSCRAHSVATAQGQTLESCMKLGSPFADASSHHFKDMRRFAQCEVQPENKRQNFIEGLERQVLTLQKTINEHRSDSVYSKHVFGGL